MHVSSIYCRRAAALSLMAVLSGCAAYPQTGDEFIAYVDSGSFTARSFAKREQLTVDQPYAKVVSAAKSLAAGCFTWRGDAFTPGMTHHTITKGGTAATGKLSKVSGSKSQLTVQFIDSTMDPLGETPEDGAFMFVSDIEAVDGGTQLSMAYTRTWGAYRDILVAAASGENAECTVKS